MKIKIKTEIFSNPFFIIIGIGVIIFLIIIAVMVKNYWEETHDNKIKITNFGSYDTDISDETKTKIYEAIYGIAKTNSPDTDDVAISSAMADIRDNSYMSSYNPVDKVYEESFIIDIPSLAQNYRVHYNINSDVFATCLLPNEYAYPFYLCLNSEEEKDNAYLSYLDNILPYSGATDLGKYIYISKLDYIVSDAPAVYIEINSCGDLAIQKEGIQAFQKYIVEHYLNPEDYNYIVPNLCDGGM